MHLVGFHTKDCEEIIVNMEQFVAMAPGSNDGSYLDMTTALSVWVDVPLRDMGRYLHNLGTIENEIRED